MKKFTAMICAVAMSASMAITAVAAPSIGQLIPEAPELVSGEIQSGYYLDVQNVDTTKYEEKAVADIVEKFNLDDTDPAYVPVSVADILEALKDYQPKAEGQDESQPIEYKTTKGNPIVPTDYESITPFVDLVLTDGTNVEYTTEGPIKATVKVEPAKNLKAEDLVLMQVDPATGVIYFIEIDEYDPVTGHSSPFLSWWEQNEAVVGFLNAWEVTGEEKYLDASLKCFEFAREHFVDHENGGWFARLSLDGKTVLSTDKVNDYTCPYHNSRMCMEIIERYRKLSKA